jgi:hypothetical protein
LTRFRLEPRDEYPHQPGPERNFNESVYSNAFDRATGLGGWMRIGNRPNEGRAELSVCLYLPDGRIACQFQRPAIDGNTGFHAGGLRVDVLEPLRGIGMEYDGELLLLPGPEPLRDPPTMIATAARVAGAVQWRHEGVSPVHGGMPVGPRQRTAYGRRFSLAHFNQHTRVTGTVRVGGQSWSLDGYGWRDHSWGPRYWQNVHWYRLFMAAFGPHRGFMLLKITDRRGKTLRTGVLLVDGEYEEVVDLDVVTSWSSSREPQVVSIGVRTARRREVITGRVVCTAPLRNRRRERGTVLESRIAESMTDFEWNGEVARGMTEYIERIEDGALAGYPL